MSRRLSLLVTRAGLLPVLLFAGLQAGVASQAGGTQAGLPDLLRQARESYKDGKLTAAEAECDLIRARLVSVYRRDPEQRRLLAGTYELRGLVQFSRGNEAGASAEFKLLLAEVPSYAFGQELQRETGYDLPRPVKDFFTRIKQATVGILVLDIKPEEAEVRVDNEVVQARPIEIELVAGAHEVTATRVGSVPAADRFTVIAGERTTGALTLELRQSSTFQIVTVPAGVEVRIGSPASRLTPGGPPPAAFASLIKPTPGEPPSGVLTWSDIPAGEQIIGFRKDCWEPDSYPVSVLANQHHDFQIFKALKRAYSTVTVDGNTGAVFVDGLKRGDAPKSMADICPGERLIEIRTDYGRSVHRLTDLVPGVERRISANPRPAVAILSVAGQQIVPGDLRVLVERALQTPDTSTITVFAPIQAQAEDWMKQIPQLQAGWLAFDLARKGLPSFQAASLNAELRQQYSERLSSGLEAQGVAELTAPNPNEPRKVLLSFLASGSGRPDVVELDLDAPGAAIAKLSAPLRLLDMSIGAELADVRDLLPGAVVVNVLWTYPDKGVLNVGDVIRTADGQAIADSAGLLGYLAQRKEGDPIKLSVQGLDGATREVETLVAERPRLIGLNDETILANKLVLDLQSALRQAKPEFRKSVIRLNLGVALMKVEDWKDALAQLDQVAFVDSMKLADGTAVDRPGISNGTVQYLRGLCLDRLDRRPEATAAFEAASKSNGALLSTDGPPVAPLAKVKLGDPGRKR